jgi:penicillin-binding protein 1A
VTRGTGARAFAGVTLPVAGKTGTTNEAKDVWFIGYTPTMAFGCFMGHDDPQPMGDEAFGGTLCAPLVAEFVKRAYASGARRPGSFEAPPGVEFVTIDRWSGRPTGAPLGGDVIAEVIRAGQPLEGLTALAGGESRVIGEKAIYLASGGSFPLGVAEEVDALPASGAAVGSGERRTARPAAPAITRELGAPGGLY